MNNEKVVLLTEVDEKRNTVVGTMGTINQTVFRGIEDALHHIFITTANGSSINILKSSEDFGWITVEKNTDFSNKEKRYYELHRVEPLSYKC